MNRIIGVRLEYLEPFNNVQINYWHEIELFVLGMIKTMYLVNFKQNY